MGCGTVVSGKDQRGRGRVGMVVVKCRKGDGWEMREKIYGIDRRNMGSLRKPTIVTGIVVGIKKQEEAKKGEREKRRERKKEKV